MYSFQARSELSQIAIAARELLGSSIRNLINDNEGVWFKSAGIGLREKSYLEDADGYCHPVVVAYDYDCIDDHVVMTIIDKRDQVLKHPIVLTIALDTRDGKYVTAMRKAELELRTMDESRYARV